jgi:hypothetical protein
MNWDAIGAIGQVLGSVAVFVTLVYLATQTRHAQEQGRRALSQARAEAIRELNLSGLDERMASINARAADALGVPITPGLKRMMDEAKLTRAEVQSVGAQLITGWTYYQQIIPYVDDLHPIERKTFDDAIMRSYGKNGGLSRIFYETYISARAHRDAKGYVDALLATET